MKLYLALFSTLAISFSSLVEGKLSLKATDQVKIRIANEAAEEQASTEAVRASSVKELLQKANDDLDKKTTSKKK